MNIFVIPSWYPNAKKVTSGIFVEEQIDALNACSSEIHQFVSTWGHSMSDLSLRSPFEVISSIIWRLTQKKSISKNGNSRVIFDPILNWSDKLPFGGVSRLLNVNKNNFRVALDICGQIDVIHAHACYPAGYIASVISKETGIPYVLTEHMSPFPFPNLLKDGEPNLHVKEAINSANAVIAVSPSLSERIESLGFEKPYFIPNLVNERLFSPRNNRERIGKFRFLTVGAMSPQKGIDTLLKAIASWKSNLLDVEFMIVGGGEQFKSYQSLASSLGISHLIRWEGEVDRQSIAQLFQNADAFVLPSRHETFGIAYCEAMASGIPVIATKCGGPQLFVDKSNGLLIDVDDEDDLASALEYMYKSARRYDPRKIRASVVSRYSRENVAKQVMEIYKSIV